MHCSRSITASATCTSLLEYSQFQPVRVCYSTALFNLAGAGLPTFVKRLFSTVSSFVNISTRFFREEFSPCNSPTLSCSSLFFCLVFNRLFRTAMLFLWRFSLYSTVPGGGAGRFLFDPPEPVVVPLGLSAVSLGVGKPGLEAQLVLVL